MAAPDISAISTSSDSASSGSSRMDPMTVARGHGGDTSRHSSDPGLARAQDEFTTIFDNLVVDDSSNVGLITVDELERRYIERVLALTAGNKSRAAQILGFDRRTLYRKIERYGRSV
ncbi:MAG TPA: helix-turn-helix domain-containing protein [Polyangiaceae bacterium]|nr:helix-turn-helix domain-containing protein [Polyangiaceae bacterium]